MSWLQFKQRKFDKGAGYYTGGVLHVVGYIAVFGLTATCTLLLFIHYAPTNVLWIPFLALALIEYGTFKWWHYAKHNAENLFQLLIAIALGVASIIGIATCTGLEMAEWFHISFADNWQQVAFIYIIVLAVLEVVGFIGVGVVSNKNLTHWADLGLGNFRIEEEAEPASNKNLTTEDRLLQLTQQLDRITQQLPAIQEAKPVTDPLAQRVQAKRQILPRNVDANGHGSDTL